MPAPQSSTDPVARAFRAEVAALRRREHRRRFPLGFHVGEPGGVRRSLEVPWPVPPEYDAGLLFDLADALLGAELDGPPGPTLWAWTTRPGVAELHDADLPCYVAAHRAFGAAGSELAGFRVVTRSGWLDPVTGRSRTWKRLRG